MGRLDDIRLKIAHAGSLSRLSEGDVVAIRSEFPGLPVEYLEFLQEVGFGDLGEIQLYSGPVEAASIYPSGAEPLTSILLIGDDMQGHCFGFDCDRNHQLVEIDPQGAVHRDVEPDFAGLLRSCFG